MHKRKPLRRLAGNAIQIGPAALAYQLDHSRFAQTVRHLLGEVPSRVHPSRKIYRSERLETSWKKPHPVCRLSERSLFEDVQQATSFNQPSAPAPSSPRLVSPHLFLSDHQYFEREVRVRQQLGILTSSQKRSSIRPLLGDLRRTDLPPLAVVDRTIHFSWTIG